MTDLPDQRVEFEQMPQRWLLGVDTQVAEEFALLEELRRKSNVNWARQPEPRPDVVHIAGYQPAPTDEVTP